MPFLMIYVVISKIYGILFVYFPTDWQICIISLSHTHLISFHSPSKLSFAKKDINLYENDNPYSQFHRFMSSPYQQKRKKLATVSLLNDICASQFCVIAKKILRMSLMFV